MLKTALRYRAKISIQFRRNLSLKTVIPSNITFYYLYIVEQLLAVRLLVSETLFSDQQRWFASLKSFKGLYMDRVDTKEYGYLIGLETGASVSK